MTDGKVRNTLLQGCQEKQARGSSARQLEAESFLEPGDAEMMSPWPQGCRQGLYQGLGIPLRIWP